jgi:hypothetical protein
MKNFSHSTQLVITELLKSYELKERYVYSIIILNLNISV